MLGQITPELETLLHEAEQLTLVSGPSGVGKSTLTERIRTDPSIQAVFGLDGMPAWTLNPGLWEGLYESRTRHLFLTYNHNRIWIRKIGTYDQDDVLSVFQRCHQLTVLTIWEEPRALRRRANARIIRTLRTLSKFRRVRKHLYRLLVQLRLRALYQEPERVWQQYREWLSFCDEMHLSAHWTLRGTDTTSMVRWSGRSEPLWD